MKNLLFTLLIAFVPALASAQLVMTPDGLVSGRDSKDYIVIDAPEISQADLFQKSLTYVNGLFEAPIKSVSSVDGQSITISGFMPRAVKSGYKRLRYTYDLDYTITMEFKDEKIKYQVISWEAGPLVNVGDYKALQNYYGVYSDSLELQNPSAKESLENFFNTFLALYESSVLKADSW